LKAMTASRSHYFPNARFQTTRDTLGTRDIACPQGATQSAIACVGKQNRMVRVISDRNRSNRSKGFLVEHRHARSDIRQNRRFVENAGAFDYPATKKRRRTRCDRTFDLMVQFVAQPRRAISPTTIEGSDESPALTCFAAATNLTQNWLEEGKEHRDASAVCGVPE
jgi:hypothetical protein